MRISMLRKIGKGVEEMFEIKLTTFENDLGVFDNI
jgi:hypothetical protein